jgi:DNA-directed RNA polymerase beta' subunit
MVIKDNRERLEELEKDGELEEDEDIFSKIKLDTHQLEVESLGSDIFEDGKNEGEVDYIEVYVSNDEDDSDSN